VRICDGALPPIVIVGLRRQAGGAVKALCVDAFEKEAGHYAQPGSPGAIHAYDPAASASDEQRFCVTATRQSGRNELLLKVEQSPSRIRVARARRQLL